MKIKNTLIATALLSLTLTQATVAATATDGSMTAFADIKWQPLGETPIQFSVVWGDRSEGASVTYLKLPAGLETGSHAHTHDYQGFTLQGTWEHEINGKWKTLPVGSHVFQPGQAFHNDRCVGSQACILIIQQNNKGDVLAPKTDS